MRVVSGNDTTDDRDAPPRGDLTALRFVGPATAAALAERGIEAAAIERKRVSYRMLVDADVNPGVAAKIRREHSLSWSFEGGEDLDRRSTQIRGLKDDERAWIAASSGDWEERAAPTADGGSTAADAERAWQKRSRPEPVTSIEGIDARLAHELAEGGITSVRSLAVADPAEVAESLALDIDRVLGWHEAANARD